jgi:predicted RNA binding protein YcfA (HicA-like mRNA interferase family)
VKTISGKRMCQVLQSKGWTQVRVTGSHHVHHKGGYPVVSVPVHGNKDLKPGTQRAIMRDAGLTDDDL